ncbi:MAG: tRNA pseudouridine65 synthase [Polaribacter sp.]|jgi:tRNA pseudouridine65 synthase
MQHPESHFSPLPIIFEDESLIAINKPSGLLVHRTSISEDTVFALQLLRDQINQRIYPVHRLDRGTSGVLLFGKTSAAAAQISEQMRNNEIHKTYLAIIRGYVAEEGIIDYALNNKDKPHLPPKESITRYTRLTQNELDFSVNRYPTSRYTLVVVHPETGRKHQIRRHFAHLRHPIIADKKHGDCKQNKYFEEQFEMRQMMLHAKKLKCKHPVTGEDILLEAELPEAFLRTLKLLKLEVDLTQL